MEKKEKVEFILEQMRLCIAVKDYIRTQIISKKINTKFFQEEGTEVRKQEPATNEDSSNTKKKVPYIHFKGNNLMFSFLKYSTTVPYILSFPRNSCEVVA